MSTLVMFTHPRRGQRPHFSDCIPCQGHTATHMHTHTQVLCLSLNSRNENNKYVPTRTWDWPVRFPCLHLHGRCQKLKDALKGLVENSLRNRMGHRARLLGAAGQSVAPLCSGERHAWPEGGLNPCFVISPPVFIIIIIIIIFF